MKIIGTVPRIDCPSELEFAEKYVATQQPVIVAGATREWKAHAAWTPDYLRRAIGAGTVRVKESWTNLHPDLFSGRPSTVASSTFADYIDLITSAAPERDKRYLSGDEIVFLRNYTQINPTLAPLMNDFVVPGYCDPAAVKTIGFWLSTAGVVASLHYDSDGSHNLNVQVRGKKRVLLFAPSQILYPFGGISAPERPHNFSQINILDPQEDRFPAFRSAQCVEALLEEGDMLFIPSYWYHAVFHLGALNINVNFWWQPPSFKLTKTSLRAAFLQLAQGAAAELNRPGHTPVPLEAQTRGVLEKMEELISRQYRI